MSIMLCLPHLVNAMLASPARELRQRYSANLWYIVSMQDMFCTWGLHLDGVMHRIKTKESTHADAREVHMIVSEDAAMLNTGIFFVRSTDWVSIWGGGSSLFRWRKICVDRLITEHNLRDRGGALVVSGRIQKVSPSSRMSHLNSISRKHGPGLVCQCRH